VLVSVGYTPSDMTTLDIQSALWRIEAVFGERLEKWRMVRRLSFVQAKVFGFKGQENDLWEIRGDREMDEKEKERITKKMEFWKKRLTELGK